MNFLTQEQIARILQVNKMTVYREIKRGKLKAYKFGKELRIRNTDFEAYLASAYKAAQQSMHAHRTCITQTHKKRTTGAKTTQKMASKSAVSTKTKASSTKTANKAVKKKVVTRQSKPRKRSK